MDAIMKGLVLDIGVYNALLWRSLAGVAIAAVLHLARRPAWPARATLRLHALRGLVTTGMAVLFFWGLARVPMAQAVALTFIAPLIALFFARVMLGEPISRRAIGGSVAASIGVLLIFSGQARVAAGPDAMWGAGAILCSAVCYAYNIILMRRQSLLADAIEVAFFQSAAIALLLALAAPFLAVAPAAHHVPPLLFASVLAVASLFLLSWAYARAEANYLAPVEYTAFLWASVLGWLVFGEVVSPRTVAGAVLIGAACIYSARRKAVPMGNLEAAT
ncbi:DMT family transporter [Sphingomonas solaris]|uniref:DMT family transporter n=2 Tax=Alterirhizorhabdus solaris TaxID=2529389 RepID=A0A558QYT2_9SPHN|nr:DMT family transporter [Sphingomonas solaris]